MFRIILFIGSVLQKQPFRSVLRKRCFENMQQTGEHPCRKEISKKLLCNFIEVWLRYGCTPVNLMHIFRTPFRKNTSGGGGGRWEVLPLVLCKWFNHVLNWIAFSSLLNEFRPHWFAHIAKLLVSVTRYLNHLENISKKWKTSSVN